MRDVWDAIIVGGGAAGLAAAGSACSKGKSVLVLERNEKIGKKLYITGKGRCNLTNDCEPREFLNNVIGGRKFLSSCIYRFPPAYVMQLFTSLGLPLKTERGNRVFPSSDKSSDVIKTLGKYACKASILFNHKVDNIKKCENLFCVTSGNSEFSARRLVIACGGQSYSSTGSDGDGFRFARKLGHTVVTPVAALAPIRLKTNVSALEGLALKNVRIEAVGKGFAESGFGELMFTADGVSGPVPLTLSSLINRNDLSNAKLIIDLKPALSSDTLDKRILSDFDKYSNKQLKNALFDLLPHSLVPYMIEYCGLDGDKAVNNVSKNERRLLLSALKGLTFDIDGLYGVEHGIVTAGGVSLGEVNPSTMESKLVEGLYFVGETLDVDALTGGFNIQIALSSGFAAGEAIGETNGD